MLDLNVVVIICVVIGAYIISICFIYLDFLGKYKKVKSEYKLNTDKPIINFIINNLLINREWISSQLMYAESIMSEEQLKIYDTEIEKNYTPYIPQTSNFNNDEIEYIIKELYDIYDSTNLAIMLNCKEEQIIKILNKIKEESYD
jgi:hypothetical protein